MKCLNRLFRFSSVLLESFYKLYVYGKRQTSGSNWEFLKIENEKNNKSSKQLLWIKNWVKLLIYVLK